MTAVKGMRRHKYQQTGLKSCTPFFPFWLRGKEEKERFHQTVEFPFPETAAEGTAGNKKKQNKT